MRGHVNLRCEQTDGSIQSIWLGKCPPGADCNGTVTIYGNVAVLER